MQLPCCTLTPHDWQGPLIATHGPAMVTLAPGTDYVLNPRTYAATHPLCTGVYTQLTSSPTAVLYADAESLTWPNITAFPATWSAPDGVQVLPTSFGHYQADPTAMPLAVFEVYEVLSSEVLMLFDTPGEAYVTAIVGRQGEKILSPNGVIHTIVNIGGDRPLVLLDVANPERHRAHKAIPQASGALLAVTRRLAVGIEIQRARP